jgi:hypothetical protein
VILAPIAALETGEADQGLCRSSLKQEQKLSETHKSAQKNPGAKSRIVETTSDKHGQAARAKNVRAFGIS